MHVVRRPRLGSINKEQTKSICIQTAEFTHQPRLSTDSSAARAAYLDCVYRLFPESGLPTAFTLTNFVPLGTTSFRQVTLITVISYGPNHNDDASVS